MHDAEFDASSDHDNLVVLGVATNDSITRTEKSTSAYARAFHPKHKPSLCEW